MLRLIKNLGLTNKVIFAGSVNWRNMPAYYSSAKLTIIPSIWSEGTSLAALESMSCGTPVVSTDIGGLPDLPTLQSKTNAADLAEKMIMVLENHAQYAENQMRVVRKTYHLENWAACWVKILGVG